MENLLDRLTKQGSELSQYNGETPPVSNTDVPESKLHLEYSINGTPGLPGYPSPSSLDMDGKTPPKYIDNIPER